MRENRKTRGQTAKNFKRARGQTAEHFKRTLADARRAFCRGILDYENVLEGVNDDVWGSLMGKRLKDCDEEI